MKHNSSSEHLHFVEYFFMYSPPYSLNDSLAASSSEDLMRVRTERFIFEMCARSEGGAARRGYR